MSIPDPSAPSSPKPTAAEARASLLSWAEQSDAESKSYVTGLRGMALKAALGAGAGLLTAAAAKKVLGSRKSKRRLAAGTTADSQPPEKGGSLIGKFFTWEVLSRSASLLVPIVLKRFTTRR